MPAAARVGDQVTHSEALSSALWGALEGALIGAVIGAAVIALTVATAGTGTLALIAIAGTVIASEGGVLSMAGYGFFKGEEEGRKHTTPCGNILTGSDDVFVNNIPAAIACGSKVDCNQHGPNSMVATGSDCVFINMKMASRVSDHGTCDFEIGKGSPDVFIGGGMAACAHIDSEVPELLEELAQSAIVVGNAMQIIGGAMCIVSLLGELPGLYAQGLARAATSGAAITNTTRTLAAVRAAGIVALKGGAGYGLSKGGGAAFGWAGEKIFGKGSSGCVCK